MKKVITFLVALVVSANSFGQRLDCYGNRIKESISKEKSIYELPTAQSTLLYDSIRALTEINDTLADAYPWISPDGLRLYYTHGTPLYNRELLFTQRANTNELFGTPTMVPLTISNPSSFWFSSNELDVYICKDSLYYAHRNSINEPFSTPSFILLSSPFTINNVKGASLNATQNTLYISAWTDTSNLGVLEFARTSPTSFAYTRTLPAPIGLTIHPGQLSKDELSFFCGATNGGFKILYEYTRSALTDTFNLNSFQQLQGVSNLTYNNIQPSTSDNLGWIVFVRNNTSYWDDNDLYIAQLNTLTSNLQGNTNSTYQLTPNPTSSTITLTIPKLINTNISITNLTGKQVATYNLQNTTTKTIDVSNLAEGVYFVTLKSDEGVVTKKLVKTN